MNFVCEYLAINIVIFLVGVAILVKGSDWFVDAAAALARSFGVPELVIGLTLVSIGTSLPELASSVCAALYGQSDFIIGNIVGSNTANIALILGAGLLLGGAISFQRKALWRDMMFLLVLGGGLMTLYAFSPDMPENVPYGFGRLGGIILLVLCSVYSIMLCRESGSDSGEDNAPPPMSKLKAGGLIVLSLIMIMLGAKFMVDTVVWAAHRLEINPLVISLTVVAFGTSLPELAVTVSGVLKKRDDIALGNIIGSGIYNIALILGCCSVITPLSGDGENALMSMAIMNATALLLFVFMLPAKKLYRWQGMIFLLLYAAFICWTTFLTK